MSGNKGSDRMRFFLSIVIMLAFVSAFPAGDGHARAADGLTIFVDADPDGTLIPGIPDMNELEKDFLHRFPYSLDANRAHALIDTKLMELDKESAKRRQRIEASLERLRSTPFEIPGVPDLDELEKGMPRTPSQPSEGWPHPVAPEKRAILRLWA